MNPIFRAIISKGKVVFDNVGLFNDYLTLLEGKNVDVIVRKHKKSRTNPQNNYLWGVCYKLISEETGYTDDEIHSTMKAMFLMDNLGKFPVVRSTTSLTTVSFGEYVEKIRQWASAELNLYIPDPEEVDFEGKYEKTEEEKNTPVSPETLTQIFGWIGTNGITENKIMQLCRENFNGREPRELTEREAGELDTIIVTSMNG